MELRNSIVPEKSKAKGEGKIWEELKNITSGFALNKNIKENGKSKMLYGKWSN